MGWTGHSGRLLRTGQLDDMSKQKDSASMPIYGYQLEVYSFRKAGIMDGCVCFLPHVTPYFIPFVRV